MRTEQVNSEPLVACCLQMSLNSELDNLKARAGYDGYECCAYDQYLGWDIEIYKRLNCIIDSYIARYRICNTSDWFTVHTCHSISEIREITYTRIYYRRRIAAAGINTQHDNNQRTSG